jgi:hypothetical protein
MRVVNSAAWVSDYEKAAFYDRHPINTTIVCYYSRKDPNFASASNSSEGRFGAYALAVLLLGLAFFGTLFVGLAVGVMCAMEMS